MKKKKMRLNYSGEFVNLPMLIWASIVVIPLIYGIYLTFTNWKRSVTHHDHLQVFPTTPQSLQIKPSCLLWKTFCVCILLLCSVMHLTGPGSASTYGIAAGTLPYFRFFAANMIGGVVMGYIWNYIFSFALTKVGAVTGWGLFQKFWLTSPGTALVF